jgi:hypothetical protein
MVPRDVTRARLGVALVALAFGACECDEQLNRVFGSVVVMPPELDFGRVPVGTAKTLGFSLENVGTFNLSVEGYTSEGPFEVLGEAGVVLPPATSTTAQARFRPMATGPAEGILRIQTDDPEAPVVEVPVRGEGIEASVRVEPSSVDFREVLRAEDAMPAAREVRVTNRGTDVFELVSAGLREDAGGTFSLDRRSAVGRFEPGATETLEVRFAPAARGASRGALLLATTAPDGPMIEVPLSGRGVGPQMEVCAVSGDGGEACTDRGETPRVDLGGIDVGQTSMGQVRVRNVGERGLSVELSQLGVGSSEMTLSPDPMGLAPFTVMPGAAWTLDVSYRPADYTFDAINLAFVSNDPDRRTQTVLVEARVPKPVANAIPRSMTFRLRGGGATETMAPLRIVNCGERPLRLAAVPNLAQTGRAFTLRDPPAAGAEVMPGDCTATAPGLEMDVVFAPEGTGTFTAEIRIETNDPITPALTVDVAGARR